MSPVDQGRHCSVPTNEAHFDEEYEWAPEIEFDWDEANIGHVARHSALPEEAEQVPQ